MKIDVTIKDYFIGEAKYWMITISDYGKGIPDSMKKELFERFYSKAKGAGLGLSIVRAFKWNSIEERFGLEIKYTMTILREPHLG